MLSEVGDTKRGARAAPPRGLADTLPVFVTIVAATALVAFLAFGAQARLAGALLMAAGVIGAGLTLVVMSERDRVGVSARRWTPHATAAGAAAVLVFFSFNGGGYYAAAQGLVVVAVAIAIALRIAVVKHPFAGANRSLVIAASALAAYGGWTLLSAAWSDAPGRAITEFVRAVLYLEVLVFFGLRPRSTGEVRILVRWLAAAITVVCAIALTTRLLPGVWPIDEGIAPERLSYPLMYWNALGVLAALGIVLALHLASSRAEPALRVAGATLMPLLAVTLYFTFSRGGMFAATVGCIAYVVAARSRGIVLGLAAAGPPTALALAAAYDANALASEDPTVALAVEQGQDVALALVAAMVVAAAVRILLLRLDRPLARLTIARGLTWSAAAVAAVALASVGLALSVPDRVADTYEQFVEGDAVAQTGDLRDRLTDPGNNHRLDHWDAAVAAYRDHRLIGTGAGTYELQWERRREYAFDAMDAHSLFAEALGELGLVGIVLLAVALATLIVRLALPLRRRGRRTPYAALLAAALAWLVHAGVDWDWEMPAVTVWLFAAAGAAGARPSREIVRAWSPPAPARIVAALACLALAVVPAVAAVADSRLGTAREAFGRNDCGTAVAAARDAIDSLGALAQPHEIIGYCELLAGRDGAPHMREAIERDPGNADYRYGLALTQAARGVDPRPALAKALRENPRSRLLLGAHARTRSAEPRAWRLWADAAPLPSRY